MSEPTQEMVEAAFEAAREVRFSDKDWTIERIILAALRAAGPVLPFDFLDFLRRKNEWSAEAFGPPDHRGHLGPLDHLRKEIAEAEDAPGDVSEFADLIFLATDAAWRAGHSPEDIAEALEAKLAVNRKRDWGDWRTKPADKAIEHDRSGEAAGPVLDREALLAVLKRVQATAQMGQEEARREGYADAILASAVTREQVEREVIERLAKSAWHKSQNAGIAMNDLAETAWAKVARWLRSQLGEG